MLMTGKIVSTVVEWTTWRASPTPMNAAQRWADADPESRRASGCGRARRFPCDDRQRNGGGEVARYIGRHGTKRVAKAS
jgi:hypothetical protein